MGWKWISRICERQQQVGPDQNVHNLPSRRLEHWRTSPTELRDHTSRYTTTGPLPCKVHVELRRLTHRVYHRRPSAIANKTLKMFKSSPSIPPAVAATTCSIQWRRDARVLGALPLRARGSLGPLPLVQYPRWFESTSWTRVAVRTQSLWVASPGSYESAPCDTWSVLGVAALTHGPPLPGGRRPLTHSPQREVVSGPAITGGAHPTASGRCAVAVRPRSLWVASPGSSESAPCVT